MSAVYQDTLRAAILSEVTGITVRLCLFMFRALSVWYDFECAETAILRTNETAEFATTKAKDGQHLETTKESGLHCA